MRYTKGSIVRIGGVIGFSYFLMKWKQLNKEYDSMLKTAQENGSKPIYSLSSFDRSYYPWEYDLFSFKTPENWEMRKIKVKGTFINETFLVPKERDGKEGYLVFRGFKTANAGGSSYSPLAENRTGTIGMMVNVGWIPKKKALYNTEFEPTFVKEVTEDSELPGLFAQVRNPYTGYVYNTEGEDIEYKIEDFIEKEVELTGYLRKGQDPDWGVGRRYFWKNHMHTYIDLKRMSALFMFSNSHSSSNYYLELAAKNLRRVAKKSPVLPSDLEDPVRTVNLYPLTQERHNVKSMLQFCFFTFVCGLFI